MNCGSAGSLSGYGFGSTYRCYVNKEPKYLEGRRRIACDYVALGFQTIFHRELVLDKTHLPRLSNCCSES